MDGPKSIEDLIGLTAFCLSMILIGNFFLKDK